MNLIWLAHPIAVLAILVVVWFTFARVPRDTNRHTRPPAPPS